MAKLGFFDVLFDDRLSFREASAINRAGDRADAAMAQGEMLGGAIGGLQARVAQQAHDIAVLRALVGVLAGVLRDTGVVDASVLDYRLEAALDEVAADAAAPAAVTCMRCGAQVPQTSTVVTELGTICDRCHALG